MERARSVGRLTRSPRGPVPASYETLRGVCGLAAGTPLSTQPVAAHDRAGESKSGAPGSGAFVGMLLLALLGSCRATQPGFDEVDVLATQARELSGNGDFGGAVERWNRIRRIDPARGPESHLELARALLALQEDEGALAALELGIEFFPSDPDLRWARGRLLTELGFRRAAESDLALVCEARPEAALAWCELAHLRAELGETQLAADTFDRALALDNCPAQADVAAARVNVLADQNERAHELFARAIERAPEDTRLLAEAAAAARVWLTAAAIEPDKLAQSRPMINAIDWARRVCRLEPQDAATETTLGALLESIGDREGALEAYHRAVEVDNFNVEAVTRLARVHVALGHTEEALALYERALALPLEPEQAQLLLVERDQLTAPAPPSVDDSVDAPFSEVEAELAPLSSADPTSTPPLWPALAAVKRVGPHLDP